MTGISTETPYAFDNGHPTAATQHATLARLLDPGSYKRLVGLRGAIGGFAGKRILEVGAGGSRLPRLLTEAVGPFGSVTATDTDPRHIEPTPGVTVVQHDITTGQPPGGPWHLIHARLVLMHLPEPEHVLVQLASYLEPGGILVIEDWLLDPRDAVLTAATDHLADVYAAYQQAVVDILAGFGTDPTWAARTHHAMRTAGLVEVTTQIDTPVWTRDNHGLDLTPVTLSQHEDRLRSWGLSDDDIADVQRLAADSRLVIRGHPLYATAGFRPQDSDQQ